MDMSDKEIKVQKALGTLAKYRVFFRGSHDRENATSTTVMAVSKEAAVKQISDAANNDPAYVGVCWAKLVDD